MGQHLGEAGLGGGDVAPLLDHGLLHLPGVGPGPGADLLGHVHTLFGGGQLGHQLGHVLAGPLGLQAALLLGGVLLDLLLGHAAHFLGPLGAPGVGGVAAGLVLALLLHHSLALHHVVLHVVHLLLGPALGLVLGAADLGTLHVAVLHQRGAADLHGLVEGDLLVLDEASLPEVLLAVLLLLGLVVGDVGGVAPLIVAVVALHHVVILDLLHHLHLVDAPLAVRPGGGAGHVIEAGRGLLGSLPLGPGPEGLAGGPVVVVAVMVLVVAVVIAVVVAVVGALGVEGEGVDQGLAAPLGVAPQLAGAQHALRPHHHQEKKLCIHVVGLAPACRCLDTST